MGEGGCSIKAEAVQRGCCGDCAVHPVCSAVGEGGCSIKAEGDCAVHPVCSAVGEGGCSIKAEGDCALCSTPGVQCCGGGGVFHKG